MSAGWSVQTELQALEESLAADVARQRAVAAAGGTRQMEPESRDAGLPVVSETGSGAAHSADVIGLACAPVQN